MLNWGLLSHPMNWITMLLMVMIAGFAVHIVLMHVTTTSK